MENKLNYTSNFTNWNYSVMKIPSFVAEATTIVLVLDSNNLLWKVEYNKPI